MAVDEEMLGRGGDGLHLVAAGGGPALPHPQRAVQLHGAARGVVAQVVRGGAQLRVLGLGQQRGHGGGARIAPGRVHLTVTARHDQALAPRQSETSHNTFLVKSFTLQPPGDDYICGHASQLKVYFTMFKHPFSIVF